MRVAISHTTRLDYASPVADGVMDARLGPCSSPQQHWERFELRVRPTAAVRAYTDGFGNAAHLITVAGPHEFVEVVAASEVVTLLDDPFATPPTPPPPPTPSERFDYLSPSQLVPWHGALEKLAAPHRPATPEEGFEAVQELMSLVHARFTYASQVTNVATTVADVLETRRGVCQDFAHVLLGLCRAVGIPSRYVSGYLVATTAHPETVGTGASHAWVEAYTPTHGWRGFDPTNNVLASELHVKTAIGRDYSDVPPTRGTFRGSAEERLTVEVITRVLP